MEELEDYSGPLRPDVKCEDFSKETLAKLLQAYCRELLPIDTCWQEQMRERLGEESARECLIENCCRIGKHEMKWTLDALNIQGNDLEAYVKANQFVPSFAQGIYGYDWELKDKKHAILTVRHCPAFAALKKNVEKLDWVCQVLEDAAINAYTEAINPDIEVKALQVGFKGEPDEIDCKWEFKLD
ncbi:MAG: hypothetical protein HOC20_01315 [Chloroflexi bacterium]|jgi:hypothetical protein|nr:hypothetical protein [Chloroflexota bacterium]